MEEKILRTATKTLTYYYESCKKSFHECFLDHKSVLKIVRHLEKHLKAQLYVIFTDSSSIKALAAFLKRLNYTSKRRLYEKERE